MAMYVAVVSYKFKPDKMEEAVSIWRDSLIATAKQQQGFKSGLLLTDPTRAKGSVSVFGRRKQMRVHSRTAVYSSSLSPGSEMPLLNLLCESNIRSASRRNPYRWKENVAE